MVTKQCALLAKQNMPPVTECFKRTNQKHSCGGLMSLTLKKCQPFYNKEFLYWYLSESVSIPPHLLTHCPWETAITQQRAAISNKTTTTSVGSSIMTSPAGTMLPPFLLQVSRSSAQSLSVDLCCCFHQLLARVSLEVIRKITSLLT